MTNLEESCVFCSVRMFAFFEEEGKSFPFSSRKNRANILGTLQLVQPHTHNRTNIVRHRKITQKHTRTMRFKLNWFVRVATTKTTTFVRAPWTGLMLSFFPSWQVSMIYVHHASWIKAKLMFTDKGEGEQGTTNNKSEIKIYQGKGNCRWYIWNYRWSESMISLFCHAFQRSSKHEHRRFDWFLVCFKAKLSMFQRFENGTSIEWLKLTVF